MDIVYYAACSADGYIATPSGGVEWLDPFNDPAHHSGFAEFEASIDVLLMGSRTYEVSMALGGFAQFTQKPCWVFTSNKSATDTPSTTFTAKTPRAVVADLATRFERAWLVGGGELASSFQRAGLIQEYRIFIAPVLLGGGIPLFGEAGGTGPLQLEQISEYGDGMVELRYRADPSNG